jgi:hypothetical protein
VAINAYMLPNNTAIIFKSGRMWEIVSIPHYRILLIFKLLNIEAIVNILV